MIMANMSGLRECGNAAYNLMLDADWGSADAPTPTGQHGRCPIYTTK